MPTQIVYWAEIQQELSAAGLDANVSLNMMSAVNGTIDDQRFMMSIAAKDEDGLRPWMVISLYGQNEETVIPKLDEFMGYKAFCKYLNKTNDTATTTYEWGKDAGERIIEIENDDQIHEITRLDTGFSRPSAHRSKPSGGTHIEH